MPTKGQLQERYLEALRAAAPGTHPADVLRSCGIRPTELEQWRKAAPFRRREEALLGEFRERQALPIAPQFIAFLDFLRACDDRIAACKQAGVRWSAVQSELAENASFRAEYDAFMQERNLQVEDALYRKGVSGDTTSGKAYLAVNDPRYGKAEAPDREPQEAAARQARTEGLLERLAKLAAAENEARRVVTSPIAAAIPLAGEIPS